MEKDLGRHNNGARFTRRSFLKKSALALSLSALPIVGCGQQAAPSAPAPSSAPASAPPSPSSAPATSAAPAVTSTPDAKAKLAQLYEAAKKEGELLWYTTNPIADAEELNKDFMQRYPGVKAQFWRNTSEAIYDKLFAEAQAGRSEVDVVQVGVGPFGEMKPLLKSFKTALDADYPPNFKHAQGLWQAYFLIPMSPVYNTQLVKASEAPKTWEDLLDPKWKGKISLEQNDSTWMLGMMKSMGREKALDYMKKLAAQQPQLRKSHLTQLDLLAAGEFSIVVVGYLSYAGTLVAKGAPLEWVRISPTVAMTSNIHLAAKAPHPNAGLLLLEYLAGVEGQQMMAKVGNFPALIGKVPPAQASLLEVKDKLLLITPDMFEELNEADQLYRDIFWPKAS